MLYEVITITVLRNGELIGEYEASELPQFDLISKMMGKALEDMEQLHKRDLSAVAGSEPVFSYNFV